MPAIGLVFGDETFTERSQMPRTYEQFEEARDVRRETLALVESLDQEQSERRPDPRTWSVGQVLDHLLKTDALIVRELELAIRQRCRGLPFVYRGVADVEPAVPRILRPVLPFFEIPFGFFNALVPLPVRNALTGNRGIPIPAPEVIRPSIGRPIDDLRRELAETFERLEQQQRRDPDVDLDRVYYYNPITGLNSVAGLYRFVSNHEQRHQKQLREILDAVLDAPRPAAA